MFDHFMLLTIGTGLAAVMGVMLYYDIGTGRDRNAFAQVELGPRGTGDWRRDWEEIRRAMPATKDRPAGPFRKFPHEIEEEEREERERQVREAAEAAAAAAKAAAVAAAEEEDEDDKVAKLLFFSQAKQPPPAKTASNNQSDGEPAKSA
jgi:hypothetical protein